MPFTLIFILSVNCFAVQNEITSLYTIGDVQFATSSVGRFGIQLGDYNPSDLTYITRHFTETSDNGTDFAIYDNEDSSINCLRTRVVLNSQYSKQVTTSDVFIYNGYFYILSYHKTYTQKYLNNNLKNMRFTITGKRSDDTLVYFDYPLSDYFTEASVYSDASDHVHCAFKVSLNISIPDSFVITGFYFDFNGIAAVSNVKLGLYTNASWDSGSLEHRPIQFYIGSASGAPQYTIPDGSIINEYDDLEQGLINQYDSKSEITSVNDNFSSRILSFAKGLQSVTKILSESFYKLPFLSDILQISLALGVFAFIFSIAQKLRRH